MTIRKIKRFILVSIACLIFTTPSFALLTSEGIQVYQKNVHMMPEHKKKLADDIHRYRNADNLWDVLREEFTLPHYEDSPAVQEKIEWFMNNQDFLLRSASRAAPYLYYILQQVRKRHLPAELVLLPIVESGYNPFSLSHAGAVGIWQLMPNTASGLGVKRDGWYDGRRDVIASTRAALIYLSYLQSFFDGNWLLAIAAYNTGEGNVLSAIKRNIRAGEDTDFWSLPLAQETRDYVPSLLALATIISHPEQYPIYFPPVRNAPYLAQVDIGKQINLTFAAKMAGISDQKMKQLNPGFTRQMTSSRGPYKLVLPIENVEQFTENFAISPFGQTPINWTHYKVKSGDTLPLIAKKFGTTIADIRKLNHLNSKKTLSHGSNILIPKSNNATVASAKTKYVLQPGDTIYMVRLKDSITSIARRFHLTNRDVVAANRLGNRAVKPGEKLIIPTHITTVAKNNTKASPPSVPKTQHAAKNEIKPGDTLYMVRRGDTIAKIAQKFRTTPASIRLANLVDDSMLKAGDQLIVPTGKA